MASDPPITIVPAGRRGRPIAKPPVESPIPITTRSTLSRAERAEREAVMSVAMSQPHRAGVSDLHGDRWMATALGRFCRLWWPGRDASGYWNGEAYWKDGDRYAQLIDADRIARGLTPRQCAEIETPCESDETYAQRMKKREVAAERLAEAEGAMREVDDQAVRAVRELAYYDRDIPERLHGRAFNALYKLSVFFERLDKPKAGR